MISQIKSVGNYQGTGDATLNTRARGDEKNALVKIINSMLTKKRMKDLLDGKVNF